MLCKFLLFINIVNIFAALLNCIAYSKCNIYLGFSSDKINYIYF